MKSIWLLRHASAEAATKEVSGCSMGGAFYAFNSSKERTTPSDGKARYPALSLGQTDCGRQLKFFPPVTLLRPHVGQDPELEEGHDVRSDPRG